MHSMAKGISVVAIMAGCAAVAILTGHAEIVTGGIVGSVLLWIFA